MPYRFGMNPQEKLHPWARAVAEAVAAVERQTGQKVTEVRTPPDPSLGDIAIPCFSLGGAAKAQSLAEALNASLPLSVEKFTAAGPYLNAAFKRSALANEITADIAAQKDEYGRDGNKKELIVEEFSSPNTNKPLHVGHIRNNLIGQTTAALLQAMGYSVVKTSVVNDRGIHICKSMLAYIKWGKGATPESAGMKGDHFVGHWYVRFAQAQQEERIAWYAGRGLDKKTMDDTATRQAEQEFLAQSPVQLEAQALLRKWEGGDADKRRLWEVMNAWVYAGYETTYGRLGVTFDKIYYESQGSERGKQIVREAAEKGLLLKRSDGSIEADLSTANLPNKVMLRQDGTALYVTNDISLALDRVADYPGLQSILYVVGSEQELYFKQLFAIFKLLGYPWAGNLRHLSHGMVNLPEGKMKSREGTVVDADDLMAEVVALAKQELVQRLAEEERKIADTEIDRRAETIGLAALKVLMLKTNRTSEITFNPKEAIELAGRTGVNLLYTYARARSVIAKSGATKTKPGDFSYAVTDSEWQVITRLAAFPGAVAGAASALEPAILVNALLDLAQAFNTFYHDQPILKAEEPARASRLALTQVFCQTLANGLRLLNIEPLEEM